MVYNKNNLELRVLHDLDEFSWFLDWLENLSIDYQAILLRRLGRIRKGNLGDYRTLGDGVLEFKFHIGPGFRVYWAFLTKEVIILIYGGTKRTQNKDIVKAKALWWKAKDEIHEFSKIFD